ncbi:MAG: M23 family metallopeptidase [Treponema sp.]|jgi:murein DD-endopeptidase MepM/ murein hydrolase activator NlpD|nr:M23 family metallopeptidase [Treponema sp.]
MFRFNRGILFALFLLFIPAFIFAMEWPTQTGVLTRNFGWNSGGTPHLGATFANAGVVTAAEAGELLFVRRQGSSASRLPSPLGSWVALDHGDGLISIYSRFDNNSYLSAIPNEVERGQPLAQSGISGWATQNGLHFQLFDRFQNSWINPSIIIRVNSPRIPAILQVRLKSASGEIINLPEASVRQGRYTVLVNAVIGNPNAPLAPFRITSTLNGSVVGALSFETYFVRDGFLSVYRNGFVPVRRVHAPAPGFEAAEVWLARGQAALEITVQDVSGITRNVIHRFTVE